MTKSSKQVIHNVADEKLVIMDSQPYSYHYTSRVRVEWRNKKPTVVPGLTMSVEAMMAKASMGLPGSIPTRVIETFYRDTDLVDIANLNNAYLELSQSVQKKHQSFLLAKEEAKKQQALNYQAMKKFIEDSHKKQPESLDKLGLNG
jgi:hypothetical protein